MCGFALRNVVSLDDLFAELARTLRPGGRIGLLEVDRPDNPVVRFGHHVYFDRVVPVIGGVLSDRDAYRYLPASTAYLPPRYELLQRLGERGLPAHRAATVPARRRPADHGDPLVSLVARTRRLDHDVDLLAVAGADGLLLSQDGLGLAGRGTALELEVDDVLEAQAALAAIEVDDEVGGPGTGVVAFGAWPFLPGPGRRLRVPEVVVGRDDRGARWVTTIGDRRPHRRPVRRPADAGAARRR